MDDIAERSTPQTEAEGGTPTPGDRDRYRRRDADTLFVMGIFFTILALAVLLGTLWTTGTKALVVNLVSGGILLLIGLGTFVHGLRGKRSAT